MGFSAGFYTYPIFKEPLTAKDYNYIGYFLQYSQESWAQERFTDAHQYAMYCLDLPKEEIYTPPTDEAIQFCKERSSQENGRSYIFTERGYWCSDGGGKIFQWFENLAANKVGGHSSAGYVRVEMDKQDLIAFAEFCWSQIKKFLPVSCVINKAFKYLPSETSQNEEDYDIRLMSCDGIEVDFGENGGIKRLDTTGEWGTDIAIPYHYYDEWTMTGYINGLNYAFDLLQTVNFEEEIVTYEGGF